MIEFKEKLSSLISVLLDHNVTAIAVGLSTYQHLCSSFDGTALDITTVTIDFKKTAAAYLFGMEVFLNVGIMEKEFKFGFRKDQKIYWSIPVSLSTTPEELNKIIKLKNYW